MKLSYSKPFHHILNYGSTTNIAEVRKFHNLGDKTFETDFSINWTKCNIFVKSGYFVKTGIHMMHQNCRFLDGIESVAKFSFKYEEVSRMRIRIWT